LAYSNFSRLAVLNCLATNAKLNIAFYIVFEIKKALSNTFIKANQQQYSIFVKKKVHEKA